MHDVHKKFGDTEHDIIENWRFQKLRSHIVIIHGYFHCLSHSTHVTMLLIIILCSSSLYNI